MALFMVACLGPRPTFPEDATPAEIDLMGQHFARLQARLAEGKLILAGRTTGSGGTGVVLLEADSEADAQAFFASDPAVQAGVLRPEIRPFRLSLKQMDTSPR